MDSDENFLKVYANLLALLETSPASMIILLPSKWEGRGMGMVCSEIPEDGKRFAFSKSEQVRSEFLVACAVESRALFDEVEDELDEDVIIEWIPEDEEDV
jgi:hypothetical protein